MFNAIFKVSARSFTLIFYVLFPHLSKKSKSELLFCFSFVLIKSICKKVVQMFTVHTIYAFSCNFRIIITPLISSYNENVINTFRGKFILLNDLILYFIFQLLKVQDKYFV